MKHITKAILFLSIVSIPFLSNAQTPKFGHINSADLIQKMPETQQSDSMLRKFGESLDGQLKTMTAEIEAGNVLQELHYMFYVAHNREPVEPHARSLREEYADRIGGASCAD